MADDPDVRVTAEVKPDGDGWVVVAFGGWPGREVRATGADPAQACEAFRDAWNAEMGSDFSAAECEFLHTRTFRGDALPDPW